MKKMTYNEINDKNYLGIITILDYRILVQKYLSKFTCIKTQEDKKIIVDLALKIGINKYRFVSYDISDDGKVILSSKEYINPSTDIVILANSFIVREKRILRNSILSNSERILVKNF